jgi:hypothetical protein
MRRLARSRQHGGALLLTVILLAVLTILGVGAVVASSRERESAFAKSKYDRVVACARAAQAKIWAEIAMFGPGYLTGTRGVTEIRLPDGTLLAAPAHYGTAATASGTGAELVQNVTLIVPEGAGGPQLPKAANLSNSGGATVPIGTVNRVVARCTDPFGRPYEVELAVRFAF